MHVCYNEIEEYACDWLENLSRNNLIAPGHVDRRSIEDLVGDDLRGFRQIHFFAGIGVWSYALRRAGVPDDFPLWTGSCPCQPFSAAGKGGGVDDERHLWPAFFHLIRECRPPVVLGEQVASKDGLGWLDLVQTDLEAAGYAIGAVDTCSASSGAPHIRQRLRFCAYDLRLASVWMGNTIFEGLERLSRDGDRERGWQVEARPATETGAVISLEHTARERRDERWSESGGRGAASGCGIIELADSTSIGRLGRRSSCESHEPGEIERSERLRDAVALADHHHHQSRQGRDAGSAEGEGIGPQSSRCGAVGIVGDSGSERQERRETSAPGYDVDRPASLGTQNQHESGFAGTIGVPGDRACPTNGVWRDADWLFCRDGKWRPVEPGTFPLVDGSAFRVGSGSPFEGKSRQGMLKAYGNAIDAEATVDFICSALAHRPDGRVARGSLEDLLD